jgi:aminoglycoside phosphotransferase (APT) family kinase protein
VDEDTLARLADYLGHHVPGSWSGLRATKFAAGQSNPTYLIASSSRRIVLRRKPSGPLLPSAHAIDREFRLLRALAQTDVPVARALHYCDDDTVVGSEFYVMEFVAGTVHWDPALPLVERPLRGSITAAMIDALAALHRVDWRGAGLSDFGRPTDYAARQLHRWSRQFRATQDGSHPGMETLIRRLEQTLPAEDGLASLVHGDFRIDNLMYEEGGARVLAVLDWELATIGHPFADLAYMLMHHRLPNAGVFRGLGGVDRQAMGLPAGSEIVARYAAATGFAVPALDFWISLSAFRLASILEGVRARIAEGNASDPERGRRLVQAIPDLIAIGLDPASAAA